jgi:hypothetical protein
VPRQNRVNPFGEILAVPESGTFMGNRGCLHDVSGHIRRSWQLDRWLICVLEFRGRKRQVMTPGHYTELFFLDEATALAAGHRPCAECRRSRFNAFRRSLVIGWVGKDNPPHSAVEIDRQLHAERVSSDHSKRTYSANLDDLPDGVFVQLPGSEAIAHLLWGTTLLLWSPGGYAARIDRPRGVEVRVLTPELTVRAIRGGYIPHLHISGKVLLDL